MNQSHQKRSASRPYVGNLLQLKGDLVLATFGQQFAPHLLAQLLQDVQMFVEMFGAPAIIRDLEQRLATFQEQAFSLKYLRPLILHEGIAKPSEVESVYGQIRKNTTLKLAVADAVGSQNAAGDLIYTDSTPQRAEKICGVLTSAILEKKRADEEEATAATTIFFSSLLKKLRMMCKRFTSGC